MRAQLERLIIICNGFISQEGVEKLRCFTEEVLIRDNKGYDVAAYKYILLKYLEQDTMKHYDELVLFNSTFFGPFYSFERIFSAMDDLGLDFWGLTKHDGNLTVTAHIQTYFLVINKKLLQSSDFIRFWSERKEDLTNVRDVINEFEIEFTRYFEALGYVWDCFVKADRYYCKNFRKIGVSYGQLPYLLLKECDMPVLKIKTFLYNSDRSIGEQLILALDYIKERTDYDISLIWKHIIRTYDVNSIIRNVYFNYITVRNITPDHHNRLAAVIFYKDKDSFEWSAQYLVNNNSVVDIYIYTPDTSLFQYLNEEYHWLITKVVMTSSDRYAETLFDLKKEFLEYYDYLCFIGCNENGYDEEIVGESINYVMWNCCLNSPEHILQVADFFNNDKHLGLLTPFPPYVYSEKVPDGGWEDYEEIKKIISMFKLHCNISRESEPVQKYFAFWCRPEILYPLLPISKIGKVNDFFPDDIADSLWSKSMTYFAQHAGYYSGTVSDVSYASFVMKRSYLLLEEVTKIENNKIDKICNLIVFAKQYQKIYIYGAGIVGKRVYQILKQKNILLNGFLVSDDKFQVNTDRNDVQVLRMSEIEDSEDLGVIVALSKENTLQVSEKLLKRYSNVHLFNKI